MGLEDNISQKVAKKTRERIYQVGPWNLYLQEQNNSAMHRELSKIVSSYPLIKKMGLVEEIPDIVQQLYLILLTNNRFARYLDTRMSDKEIDTQIRDIELHNILTREIRKKHPEAFRLARRISTIIQTDPTFKQFNPPEFYQRVGT